MSNANNQTQRVVRKAYNRVRSIADVPSDSKTAQDFGNDTDVNTIVERFKRTGELNWINTQEPHYGDVTGLQGDLTETIERGKQAQKELEELQNKQIQENEQKTKENEQKLKEYEQLLQQKQTLTDSENND